jgi:predicted DCC family thiol-disulfide oxidoreductase YuxK
MAQRPAEFIELVFDGDCGLCRACVAWLQQRDSSQLVSCIPSAACTWPERFELPFSESVVVRVAHTTTLQQSSAVAAALSALPRGWGIIGRSLLRCNQFRVLRLANDRAYRLVANHRSGISSVLVRLRIIDAACLITQP